MILLLCKEISAFDNNTHFHMVFMTTKTGTNQETYLIPPVAPHDDWNNELGKTVRTVKAKVFFFQGAGNYPFYSVTQAARASKRV